MINHIIVSGEPQERTLETPNYNPCNFAGANTCILSQTDNRTLRVKQLSAYINNLSYSTFVLISNTLRPL